MLLGEPLQRYLGAVQLVLMVPQCHDVGPSPLGRGHPTQHHTVISSDAGAIGRQDTEIKPLSAPSHPAAMASGCASTDDTDPEPRRCGGGG